MAVDKQLLEQCVLEAAGDDAEMADFLRKRYAANDNLAAKFVGGYMRTADYTKKTQELSSQRQQFEQQGAQLDTVRKALEAAEKEKDGILKELAGHRIGTAKARELMKMLQEKYQLTDADLPGMSDLIETAKKGKPVDTTEDVDARIKAAVADAESRMEKKFAGAMVPELGAMAAMPLIWQEISREHQELTGKNLSYAEAQEILKSAREGGRSLRDVWEEKFQIGGDSGLRMVKRDERLKAQWQSDREKAEAAERDKRALEVVTPAQADFGSGPNVSPVFKTKFREFPSDPNAQPGQQQQQAVGKDGVPVVVAQPGQHVRQEGGGHKPTGAQRAAQKFISQQTTQGRKTA